MAQNHKRWTLSSNAKEELSISFKNKFSSLENRIEEPNKYEKKKWIMHSSIRNVQIYTQKKKTNNNSVGAQQERKEDNTPL